MQEDMADLSDAEFRDIANMTFASEDDGFRFYVTWRHGRREIKICSHAVLAVESVLFVYK